MAVNLEFENRLWDMADKLRGNIEGAEYKHVVLGLIFLKYISDAFDERFQQLVDEGEGFEEEEDAYLEKNVFFVPPEARWQEIKAQAKQPTIGQAIDNAMIAIEKLNPALKGVLPKNYARPEIDKAKLGELIDLFSFNLGDEKARAQDVLGRVYEYFLGKFGSSEGEFYTPPSVVKLLVGMIEPFKGRVYEILTTSLIQPYPVQRNWQQTGYKRILLATETAKAAFFMDIKKPPIFSTGGAMLRLESRYHF